jgi:hypothetical protein
MAVSRLDFIPAHRFLNGADLYYGVSEKDELRVAIPRVADSPKATDGLKSDRLWNRQPAHSSLTRHARSPYCLPSLSHPESAKRRRWGGLPVVTITNLSDASREKKCDKSKQTVCAQEQCASRLLAARLAMAGVFAGTERAQPPGPKRASARSTAYGMCRRTIVVSDRGP